MQPLLIAKEVAAILRIHEVDVYDLVKCAGLPALRVGKRRLRFDPAALANWLTGQRPAADPVGSTHHTIRERHPGKGGGSQEDYGGKSTATPKQD